MAECIDGNERTPSSNTAPPSTSRPTESFPLTPITSHAQTSTASSNDSVQVFSEGSRSRSNTPSSLASSSVVTSPESTFGAAKAASPLPAGIDRTIQPPTANTIQSPRFRTNSHDSTRSRPSPRLTEAHNSGHHASQTLETIPQAALPPPVLEAAQPTNQDNQINITADHSDTHEAHAENDPPRTNVVTTDRTDSWWSAPLAWPEVGRRKLKESSPSQKFTAVSSMAFTIVTLVYFSYRAYKLQQWQAVAELYNVCQNVKPGQGRYENCQELLKIPLSDPPFSNIKRQLEEAERRRLKRDLTTRDIPLIYGNSSRAVDVTFFILLAASLLALAYTSAMWIGSRPHTPSRNTNRSWRSSRLWPTNRQHLDHFSPVNVRIAPNPHNHSNLSVQSHPEKQLDTERQKEPTLPNHLRQKRQIHILSELSQQSETRRKSLKSDESLTDRPAWKLGGLSRADSVSIKDPDDASTLHSEVVDLIDDDDDRSDQSSMKVGDFMKGHSDNSQITQRKPSSTTGNNTYLGDFRKKLHSRYPKLPYFLPGGEDSSDDEPILTALGAEPFDSFNPDHSDDTHVVSQRKNVVLSGFVAVAMAQAGSALASTAGGAIGRNILVQYVEDEAEDIHDMITTGKKRRPTDLVRYEVEKHRFLQGNAIKRRITRHDSGIFE